MGVRAAPEFEAWLAETGIAAPDGTMRALADGASPFVRQIAENLS
jgi:ethanolamine ammonia-lyase large subunit